MYKNYNVFKNSPNGKFNEKVEVTFYSLSFIFLYYTNGE